MFYLVALKDLDIYDAIVLSDALILQWVVEPQLLLYPKWLLSNYSISYRQNFIGPYLIYSNFPYCSFVTYKMDITILPSS